MKAPTRQGSAGQTRDAAARAGLAPGLYLVSTPIGAARDITLRALDVLRDADVLAAEDTRTLRHLMEIQGIPLRGRPILAYHDHSDARARETLLAHLREGRSLAYASEAGTPLIADPGFQLVRAVTQAGIPVTAAPGPSALLMALTLSGLPSDRFLFAGFPPARSGERRRWLAGMGAVRATLVLYESPKRINQLLGDLVSTWGGSVKVALCREMTKRFEEVLRGTLDEVVAMVGDRDLKGEIVLVVDRSDAGSAAMDIEAELTTALQSMSIRDAADAVAGAAGLPRRDVYKVALKLKTSDKSD